MYIMNGMRMNTRLITIFFLAGVLASCGGSSQKDKQEQIKYEIQVMKPESRVYNLYIPAALHGVSEVEVYPQVSGIIREVNFKDGIKVTKGQTLFVIDQTEHKLKVQNAQANLAAAKAQMETTKLQYETNQKLAEKRIVSEYVMSTSMNAYHVAQAAVQQAQAQLAMAQTNLGYCTVKSPITGIIKENGFKLGEMADLTDMLCSISDNSEIQAWFPYTESQLLDLLARYDLKPSSEGLKDIDGKTVGAKLPKLKLQLKNGQEYEHEGVVTEIGGIVDIKTGTVVCKATFPNPDDELRSGLSATLVFPTKMNGVFRIPKTAAVHLQNQLLFYRVRKDGTVEGVICEAIPSNSGMNYYVKSGLKSGDEVVINGVQNLSNGTKVR
jgi:membrane fusion protein (multidrug efflux system)